MRNGISRANSVREYAATIVNTGSCLAVRVCPNPTGTHNVGEPEVIRCDLARDIGRLRSRIRRQVGRPQLEQM